MNFTDHIRTNRIISTEIVIANRLKKCKIEFGYILNKIKSTTKISPDLCKILDQIIIDEEIIFNPLFNLCISKIKKALSARLAKNDKFNPQDLFKKVDSNNFDRIFEILVIDLIGVKLFYDLKNLKELKYIVEIYLHDSFYIPLYYKSQKGIKVKVITTRQGRLYFDNREIKKQTGIVNDFYNNLYFLNDSSLVYECNNLPSLIIGERRATRTQTIKKSYSLLRKYFKNESIDLPKIVSHAFIIQSDDTSFFSGNDESNLGLIYLPNIKNEFYFLECLIHEFLHQKLCSIEDIGAIFEDNSHEIEKFYSPWRNDPRPLRMIIHGLFVFTAIMEYWLILSQNKIHQNSAYENIYKRLKQNQKAISTLKKHSKFSKLGKVIFAELCSINKDFKRIIENKLRVNIKVLIDKEIRRHKNLYKIYVS